MFFRRSINSQLHKPTDFKGELHIGSEGGKKNIVII